MSTIFFIFIILLFTYLTIAFNILTSKLSKVEANQRELETLLSEQSQTKDAWNACRDAVKEYNETLKKFPFIMVAGIFGFKTIFNEEFEEDWRMTENMEYVKLNNGLEMPMLGFGSFRVEDGRDAVDAVKAALAAGYRSIDTAAVYGNEKSIGIAIKESGVPREEIFLTTKLWNEVQRTGNAEEAFEQSLKDLGTDYVDLYLIHWPVKEKYVESWLTLEKIYKSGRAKAIGVSNFKEHHLEDIRKVWSVVPAVNQVELHPFLTQKPLLEYCKNLNIAPQSWGPLGGTLGRYGVRESLLENDVIKSIGAKYGKTAAQVILRWNIDSGIVAIPKSTTPGRIKENIDIFDFSLTKDEIEAIDSLNKDQRVGSDPDTFDF